MSSRFPVTSLGLGVAAVAVASYGVGWFLGWREFVVVAIGFGLALLIAVPFVVGGNALHLERAVEPERVEVGKPSTSVLTLTNTGRSRSASRLIEDRIGTRVEFFEVQSLAPQASSQAITTLPTAKRGVVDVGPALVTRADPLGLLARDIGRTGVTKVWVRPRTVPLNPMRSGFAKDLEGPTFDTSPAGDVAFHTIREYAAGDDIRHIHWLSTAKTGTLMVRHYVDNRRPYIGVLVDTDPRHVSEEGFERSLEVAASMARGASLDGRPLALWVGEQEVMSARSVVDPDAALDGLCLSALRPGGSEIDVVEEYRRLASVDRGVSALLFVTGERPAEELLALVTAAKREGRVVIARFVADDAPPALIPGVTILDCRTLEEFALRWARITR